MLKSLKIPVVDWLRRRVPLDEHEEVAQKVAEAYPDATATTELPATELKRFEKRGGR